MSSARLPLLVSLAALGALPLASTPASAQTPDAKAACIDAATKGQELRNAHKLVEAREKLRACAAAACPAVVQSDCEGFLAEVERALPTVVVSAKNGAGTDLVDVTVTVDGLPLVSKLDGTAVPMNAGAHTFHFETADGSKLDQQVVVAEGEKDKRIAVVLLAPAPAQTADTAATADGSSVQPRSGPWRTLGWVLGGAGVAGLGVGAVAGVVALGDKNGAHCDANNVCDPGAINGIKSAALVSDIGWIAGGVLLATGAALVLFAPHGSEDAGGASVAVAPMLVGGGAALGALGSF